MQLGVKKGKSSRGGLVTAALEFIYGPNWVKSQLNCNYSDKYCSADFVWQLWPIYAALLVLYDHSDEKNEFSWAPFSALENITRKQRLGGFRLTVYTSVFTISLAVIYSKQWNNHQGLGIGLIYSAACYVCNKLREELLYIAVFKKKWNK